MTDETWKQLLAVGVVEGSDLLVDFYFDAPSPESAEALAKSLEPEATTVHTRTGRVGLLRRRNESRVSGFMYVEAVSRDRLRDWVSRMVITGENHGCRLDGWGAEAPDIAAR